MSDPGYEYECSRAELLGIDPPSYEEYLKKVAEKKTTSEEEEQADDIDNLGETSKEDENAKVATGRKLDEINNILQSTQEKLNRFKVSYGSLTNVLKTKLGKSLDISFSQSEASEPQTNDDTSISNTNTDKGQEPIIGSTISDNDKEMSTNKMKQNGQSLDMNYGSKKEEETYKEIELNDDSNAEAKSQETKKFLNFSFLNLGGGK